MKIYYRGSLSSCNYACDYCPFAKTANTRAELRQDQRELERFVGWVAERSEEIGILFTPWGEALIHRYYRRAMNELARMPHVSRVAIQTNLSAPLRDLEAHPALALWTTFHPTQTTVTRFVARCRRLEVRYSVGVVGLREHFDAIDALRGLLPPSVYLWINAYKRVPDYYTASEIARLRAVDPHFHWNLERHPSLGRVCGAGETSFSVDGAGNMRRCHFVPDGIGNIYQDDFRTALRPRLCPAQTCGCHIGYIHMPHLGQEAIYGAGMLERIPFRP